MYFGLGALIGREVVFCACLKMEEDEVHVGLPSQPVPMSGIEIDGNQPIEDARIR